MKGYANYYIHHVYAFGALFGESTNGDVQRFKYNGKEYERMHGLNWYDYGARHYDAAIGSWPTVDPLAEKYYNLSPYNYCGDNPVTMADFDGRDYWSTNDKEQITTFLNAVGQGWNQFDFSAWNHATDGEILGSLVYNDQTNKYYASYGRVVDGEVTIYSKSFDANLTPVSSTGAGYKGAFVYEPLEGFMLLANHYLNGTTYFDGIVNWQVNSAGRITGVAPIIGIAPTFGRGFKGGKMKMGRAIGKMSGNRNVQKELINALVRKHNLNKDERRALHDEISHQGYSYEEIDRLIFELFKK